MLAALLLACNELVVGFGARRAAANAMTRDLDAMDDVWTEYAGLSRRSYLRLGVLRLERVLENAGRGACRTGHRELSQRRSRPSASGSGGRRRGTCSRRSSWRPTTASLKASLRYCEGHLHRIDGEAEKLRRRTAAANQHFTRGGVGVPRGGGAAAGLARSVPRPRADVHLRARGHRSRGRRDAPGAEVRVLDRRSRDRAARRRLPGAWRHALADGAAACRHAAGSRIPAAARRRRTGRRWRSTSGSPASPTSRVNLRRTRRALDQIEVRMSELESGKDEPGAAPPMAITYTTAAERDVRRAHHRRWSVARARSRAGRRVGPGGAADVRRLPGGLCDLADGRHRGADRQPEHRRRSARPSRRVFEPVLPMPGDRRLAARELLSFLVQADGARRTVPNVGAIARVRVPDSARSIAPRPRRRIASGCATSAPARRPRGPKVRARCHC